MRKLPGVVLIAVLSIVLSWFLFSAGRGSLQLPGTSQDQERADEAVEESGRIMSAIALLRKAEADLQHAPGHGIDRGEYRPPTVVPEHLPDPREAGRNLGRARLLLESQGLEGGIRDLEDRLRERVAASPPGAAFGREDFAAERVEIAGHIDRLRRAIDEAGGRTTVRPKGSTPRLGVLIALLGGLVALSGIWFAQAMAKRRAQPVDSGYTISELTKTARRRRRKRRNRRRSR